MIVYIYDDKEGKTNAISIDKKNMVDEDLEFFNDHSIRKVWHSGEEEWYLSVVDVVQVLTDSSDPKQYIKKMRARDKALESKWGTICTPLQMLAPDGKMRKTQAANTEGILRIIQSIPSPKAEPFKTWLAKVGAERLEEIADPEKAMERAVATYKAKGYSDKCISQRLRTIEIRKELTDEWQNAGIKESKEFAALTNILIIAWSGKSVQEYKKLKGLKKENLFQNHKIIWQCPRIYGRINSSIDARSQRYGYLGGDFMKRADNNKITALYESLSRDDELIGG